MEQHLETLRLSRPGCEVVAFGDAKAQIVLRASHERTYRREHLDRLCEQAATSFHVLRCARRLWQSEESAHEVIRISEKTATIFVKESTDAVEFLCLVGDATQELDALIADAKKTLSLILADL